MEDKIVKGLSFTFVWLGVGAFCTVIGVPLLGFLIVGPLVAATTLED
jgi:hypothetical protein